MRHTAIAIALLAAGAALNCIVAWRCTNFSGAQSRISDMDPTAARNMLLQRSVALTEQHEVRGFTDDAIGLSHVSLMHSLSDASNWSFGSVDIISAGWPFRALYCEFHSTATPQSETTSGHSYVGIPQHIGPIRTRGYLPSGLLGLGFTANTLIYSAAAFFAMRTIAILRRRRRLDHRRCAHCKYPLLLCADEDVQCAECGHTFTAQLLSRPRQLYRLWFWPLLLPPLYLFVLWLLSEFPSPFLLFELRHHYPIINSTSIVTLLVSIPWLFILAFCAYRDRTATLRWLCALLVSLTLGLIAYVAVYIAVVHLPSVA